MDEQQRRYLAEDAGDEAEALAPVVAALAAWDAPEPAADETARLVMRLQAEMVAGRPLADKRPFARLAGWWPWQLLRAQARVVQREIWWGSALVLALGVLVSVLLARAGETAAAAGLPLVLLAPVVAAVGVAVLTNGEPRVWELEMVTAVSPRLLLLSRLLLLFAFNLLAGLAASVALALVLPAPPSGGLLGLWLAPMTFLSAVAFLLTVLTGRSEPGILICLGLWGLNGVRRFGGLAALLGWLPDLLAQDARLWLWLLAAAAVGVGVWWGGREEGWLMVEG